MQTYIETSSVSRLHRHTSPGLPLLGEVQSALEGILAGEGVRHAKQNLSLFFQGLANHTILPRQIDFITHNELMRKPGFQDLLAARLEDILGSAEILSDGARLQEFLLVLAMYPEVFMEVALPPPAVEVLHNRVEYLGKTGQRGSIITTLTGFLTRH